MSVLTKEDDERTPIKQAQSSFDAVKKAVDDTRNTLSEMVLHSLAVEQERAHRVRKKIKADQERFSEIEEGVSSGMADLEDSWTALNSIDLPLDFEKALQDVKKETDNIVALKLALIKDLEREVMERDHEYVDKLAFQKQQIDDFARTMRGNEESIYQKMKDELQKTLQSFEQERSMQQLQIEREVKQIAAKRQEREQMLMKEVEQTAIEQRDALEEIRRNAAEEYMTLRTEFEMKLQAAQKELEDSLAQYTFSLEQLDYDFRILQENEAEHEEKVKLQNKKMIRQRDCLRALKRRYAKEDAEFQRINAEITKDYKRIAQSYRELQLRFRNVAYNDFNAFREVWNLNERKLHELVLKALEANRVVMVQQLGKDPKNPDPDYLKRWIIGTEDFEDLTKTPQVANETQEATQTQHKESPFLHNKQLSEPLEHLWKLVSDEVGFLVEERVKNLIGMDPKADITENQELIRVDLLLQDLGITQTEDVEQLLSYFLRDSEFGELEETPGFVKPHEVLEGLRKFVDAYHPNQQHNQASLFAQISQDATQNTSSEVARAILQLQKKLNRQMPAQRKFLEKKSDVISEDMWRIWNAGFKAIQRYVKELEERVKLIEETDSLKQQNSEFEMLLSQYLESENNDSLIYAPAETVDFQS